MKFLATLFIAVFAIHAFGQQTQQVLKSDLEFKQPFKAPYGTTYINPLDFKYINVKKGKDTLELQLPYAKRFYPTMDSLPTSIDDDAVWSLLKWNDFQSDIEIEKVIKPFFIQNHEVTNNEYRMFLNTLSSAEKAKNYPDTTRWVEDFKFSYNEPMQRVYFAHPKYDDYPVVGINYYQAKAFCKWIESRLNNHYNLKGSKIEVDLPNQFEWAFANGDKYIWSSPKVNPYFNNQFFDKDYVTDLKIDHDSGYYNLMNSVLLPGYANTNSGNFMNDGYLYTHSYNQIKRVKGPEVVHNDHLNDVYYLNTNVSEWCSETYQDNWKELFDWRQKMLRSLGTTEAIMTADLETYYNGYNDTISGQLVRGGNWLYEHHAFRNGQNVGMHDAKLFINPNESHSTVGFRYVIRVVEVEEPTKTVLK